MKTKRDKQSVKNFLELLLYLIQVVVLAVGLWLAKLFTQGKISNGK